MRRIVLIMLMIVLSTSIVTAQETTCPVLVNSAIEIVGDACSGLDRNQVCYGHDAIVALDFDSISLDGFSTTGDIIALDNVLSIATAPMNVDEGIWGVAMLSLQANLSATLPGQNVTFVIFGDTELVSEVIPDEDNSEPLPTVILSATGSINVRTGPGTGYALAGALSTGDRVTVIGRNDVGDWVQIDFGEVVSWVYAPLMSVEDGDVMTLPVLSADEVADTPLAPMQAFSFSTGIGELSCDEAPQNGLLIQTPQDTVVNFLINGIEFEIGSTVFLKFADNTSTIYTLEGAATVTAVGQEQIVEAGYRLDASISTAPQAPYLYDNEDVQGLPVDVLPEAILVPITIPSSAVDWFDTGIELEAGQTFTISAWGSAQNCKHCTEELDLPESFSEPAGPEGNLAFQPCDGSLGGTCVMMPGNYGALVGKVGDGEPFHIGTGGTFTADRTGPLYFAFNDFEIRDNTGGFSAVVDISQ